MSEHQIVEYKQSWRDEYLKWICGFANAQGGRLLIGKDNEGKTVTLLDVNRLLEEIPNKVRDILGIMVEAYLENDEKGAFIRIEIEKHLHPISYLGRYFVRNGATNQELKGNALNQFLLRSIGRRWDAVPMPNVTVEDLKTETFTLFKKRAIKSNRLPADILTDSNHQILENLHLTEGELLKRAAILLFHPNPQKFISGAYIKIGYFEENDADLRFQDEVFGNLFEQIDKTLDLLFSKYIKALISYEGVQRIEKYEFPFKAIREGLLNAVAHKDYNGNTPIQISVYPNELMIWNEGQLPETWTIETLHQKHPSKPFNPDIANTLFKSGYIEAWGRGMNKMLQECEKAAIPKPHYFYDTSGFWVRFKKDALTEEYLKSLNLNERQIKAVFYMKYHSKMNNGDYQKLNECSRNTASNDLSGLVTIGLVEYNGQKGEAAFYFLKT
jgi:ATP-dependent DNA helicase RecG